MDGRQSWTCQGRHYHGWFGDGTCDDSGRSHGRARVADAEKARLILAVINGTVGMLPAPFRGRWERWLRTGGAEVMSKILEVWSAVKLDRSTFQTRFFPGTVGERAVAAAYQPADATRQAEDITGDALASAKFGDLVQVVGLDACLASSPQPTYLR